MVQIPCLGQYHEARPLGLYFSYFDFGGEAHSRMSVNSESRLLGLDPTLPLAHSMTLITLLILYASVSLSVKGRTTVTTSGVVIKISELKN